MNMAVQLKVVAELKLRLWYQKLLLKSLDSGTVASTYVFFEPLVPWGLYLCLHRCMTQITSAHVVSLFQTLSTLSIRSYCEHLGV